MIGHRFFDVGLWGRRWLLPSVVPGPCAVCPVCYDDPLSTSTQARRDAAAGIVLTQASEDERGDFCPHRLLLSSAFYSHFVKRGARGEPESGVLLHCRCAAIMINHD